MAVGSPNPSPDTGETSSIRGVLDYGRSSLPIVSIPAIAGGVSTIPRTPPRSRSSRGVRG